MANNLVGQDGAIQPVADVLNTTVNEFHQVLEVLSHEVGLVAAVHGVTELGEEVGFGDIGLPSRDDGGPNLLTDVVNAPTTVLSGNTDGLIHNVGTDLSNVVHDAFTAVDTLIFPGAPGLGNDPTNPVPELIQGLGNTLQTGPLATLDGSNGLIGGTIGDLSHSGTGHLIDAVVGGEQPGGGLIANVLAAAGADPQHAVEVHAVDVGPTGPNLADLHLLGGSGDLLGGGATPIDGALGGLLAGHGGLLG